MFRKIAVALASVLFIIGGATVVAPAAQAACSPATGSSPCPYNSEWHTVYRSALNYLHVGDAEWKLYSFFAGQDSYNINFAYNAWTGTTWSYRRNSNNVHATIWTYSYSPQIACRYDGDVTGADRDNIDEVANKVRSYCVTPYS